MSLKTQAKTPEQALEDYLDGIYIQSHSQYSVASYRTAINGQKNGFRIFLKEKYNCDEIQLTTRIQNQELDVYNILNEYVIFLDKKSSQEDKAVKYRVRFNFRTIEPREYIGGKYDPLLILSDIEKKLPSHIKRAHYQQDKNSPQIFADYFFNYDDPNIAKQEKRGFLARLLSNDPYDELLEKDLDRVKDIIKKTYGISKDKQNKIEHTVAREGRD